MMNSSFADEEKNSRKGFVVGIDVGAADLRLSNSGNEGAFLGGFKVGWGVHERVLLFLEETSLLAFNNVSSTIQALYVSGQFFLLKNFYVRPGVGYADAEEDAAAGIATTNFGNAKFVSTDLGFTAAGTAGYEFRIKKKFALSPEGKFGYLRLGGANHLFFGAVLDMRWYF